MTQKALIIGATSGIGRAIALQLLDEGWTLGLAGRREQALQEIAEAYPAGRVCYQALDITQASSTTALDHLLEKLGAPQLFLHVSGIGFQNPELEADKEIRIIQTNCEGMTRMLCHFIRFVKESAAYDARTPVRIAVVTSVAGTAGMGIAPAYSASKAMQSRYVSALAQLANMEDLPIVFSDIRPGFVSTALLNPDKHYPMMMSPERAARYILSGLKRGKRIIIFDWRYRLIVFFWRLVPRGLWERFRFVKTQ